MSMRGQVRYQIPAIGVVLITLAAIPIVAAHPIWKRGTEVGDRGLTQSRVSLRAGFAASPQAMFAEPRAEFVEPAYVSQNNVRFALAQPEAFLNDEPLVAHDPQQPPVQSLPTVDDEPAASPNLPVQSSPAAEPDPFREPADVPLTAVVASEPHSALGEDVEVSEKPQAPPAMDEAARLKVLEKRFAELLKETAAVRREAETISAARAKMNDPKSRVTKAAGTGAPTATDEFIRRPTNSKAVPAVNENPTSENSAGHIFAHRTANPNALIAVETETITRATYKHPRLPFVALATFLSGQLNDEFEFKVTGGQMLQITGPAEDLPALDQLIRLLASREVHAALPIDSATIEDDRETDSSATAPAVRYRIKGEPVMDVPVSVSRVLYKLPAGRSAVLVHFIGRHLSDEIEARQKNDLLQITATPEDLKALNGLIRLLQKKGRPRADVTDQPPVMKVQIVD